MLERIENIENLADSIKRLCEYLIDDVKSEKRVCIGDLMDIQYKTEQIKANLK